VKFLILESQLKPEKFQKLIDLSVFEIRNDFNSQTEVDFCNNLWKLKKVDVVRVFLEIENGKNIFDIGLLIQVEDTDFFDTGEFLFQLNINLSEYIGKENFKIKLLNVIYK
jgi:hypothetical protein